MADSFLLAKQALFPQDDTLVADRKTIAAHCVWGLQVQDLPEWERAMDDIRATLDDDPALRGWFDEAFARYRPRLEPFRLRGPRLGYEGGALHLDTRRFGVEDVSGAVALCERILSYRASGIPLPHVPARPPAPLASDAPGSDRGALAALQWDELALFRLLERYVETRTMIDVGAHRGTTLAPFLEAGWQVYAFEPMAANRERLARRFGQHPALVLRPEAVSDSTGTKPFHLAVGRDGRLHEYYHSLERTAEDAHHRKGDTVDQATVSLDDLVAKGELPATIGFLKVDTEGHDLAVLRGAARLACEAIGVEFWRDGHPLGKSLSPAEAMLGLLADRGYDRYLVLCHRLDGSTALLDHTLEGIPDDAWGNIVAFHATRRTLYERVCEAMRWLGGLDVTAERNELHAQLAAKEATIQNQAAQLVAKETMLQDQAAQLVAKETVLQDQAAQLVAKETVLQNQAAQLASKERVIQDQAAAIQTKDAALQELSAGWFQRLRRRIRAGRA